MRLAELDENQLLQALSPYFRHNQETLVGVGDDCALIAAPDSQYVVSTDMIIGEQDFKADWSRPWQIGRRLAMQNLADIAAMGARPTALVLSLALPNELELDWLKSFYQGLDSAAKQVGAVIVGGDLSRFHTLILNATVMGSLDGTNACTRDGGEPGDLVAVAGHLGFSYAGLDLCRQGYAQDLSALPAALRPLAAQCRDIFKSAEPPLAQGPRAAKAGAKALIDTSDGLLVDLTRIAKASQVSIELSIQALDQAMAPLRPLADFLGKDAKEWVLYGGEDHALAGLFPPDATVPKGFQLWGKTLAGSPGTITLAGTKVASQNRWDHFGGTHE
ncbi:thiamine-phosphate kinase [Boudabousia tangfeifanii]|uniref:Thiamine-monophosphate kinase n=1 Tax=Boudabousia tangfeifanii TaxID=1912795 RepID=A0A1D9ML09_9ACTO|nr:thiamine-phosphate kinase [Boudabousia tangfeifanii]AOZ72830.1 thiamine-phosphate kinase [Boudabousia tangfeifanii]